MAEARPITISNLNPSGAVADIVVGLSKWRIWISLSWHEFASTYKRSMLGVLWVMLSFAGFVFVKIIVFSSLLDADDVRYYDAYLVVGFFVWVYLQNAISSAPDTFTSVQGWIKSEPLPLSLYIYKTIMREFYNFALTFLVVIGALAYLEYPVTWWALFSFPAFLFFLINAFSLKLLIGVISTRMRDLSHLVKAIMMPMLFLTPIFWMPEQMGRLMDYLWWNPLYHYIEIFRAPIVVGKIPWESWFFTAITFSITTIFALITFMRFRQRIVFWL